MEDADDEINFRGSSFAPPPWLSLTPFPSQASPSPRRLSIAAANSKKNKQIIQLTKSVEIRDQEDSTVKALDNEDMIKSKIPLQIEMEPEERRMSDLSDWAPSVSSTVDNQWNTSSIEQDLGNPIEESEDKDALINELSAFINTTESLGSKRISELEDIIRHKNMIITKLRKDMMVLEQKVIHLTRLRRSSTSKSNLSSNKLPTMTDNLVYDMDSTTSPSSSDSDSSTKKNRVSIVKTMNVQNERIYLRGNEKKEQPKSSDKLPQRPPRPVSPLKEKSMNQQINSVSGSGDFKSRRSGTNKSRVSGSNKRWV
ncbi:hypothetical protein L2E82_28860 [Cichorium intybus]|uniref:Uncharacterized protein n=1 Tax=Cichorium intybus TaxID=13427 RepID=A0ACB9CWR0_CICIN|nr:hypothetical protein L2E82_28860 [Cichorium intybus]